ncbi:MAG: hypothetical protein ABL930_06470, partial [Pseudobdellovibrio sp.]
YRFIENPVYDRDYGYRMTANCECRDILKIKNLLLWDLSYRTDKFGRRFTEGKVSPKTDEFVVFYGGSRTFGQGVLDGETLASNFQKLTPSKRVYNYGIINSGANTFLKQHEDQKFKKEIPEKQGLFLYVFDLGHEQKILGTKYAVSSYAAPFYDYNDKHELVYFGSFWMGRPFKSFILNLLSFSAVYQNIFLNYRPVISSLSAEDNKLVNAVILKMKKEVEAFGNSKFAVVFFETVGSAILDDLSRSLSEAGVDVLYFDKSVLPANDNKNYYKYDRHPKASTYVVQAQLLQQELIKKSWLKK